MFFVDALHCKETTGSGGAGSGFVCVVYDPSCLMATPTGSKQALV
jgi:hypothetical protein